MAELLALQVFGARLLVKGTFLEFDLRVYAAARAKSTPPVLVRVGAARSGKPKKKPKKKRYDEEEEALCEGRRQVLHETWQQLAVGIGHKMRTEAKRAAEARKTKRRVTLSRAGLSQVARVLGHTDADVFLLFVRGFSYAGQKTV